MKKDYLLMRQDIPAKLVIFFMLSLFFVSTAKAQQNLLQDPGFEDTYTINYTSVGDQPGIWGAILQTDLAVDGTVVNNAQGNRLPATDAFFTNNPTFIGVHGGSQAGRLPAMGTAGIYQLVNVVAGHTYDFKAYALNFRTNLNNQTEMRPEYLRIKSVDGLIEYAKVEIPFTMGNVNTWLEVSGSVTIPAGVEQVRFQISHYSQAAPFNCPATLIDDCEFIDKSNTGVPDVILDPAVQIISQNGTLIVKSEMPIKKVEVINFSGQLLRSVAGNGNSMEIKNLLQAQALIVKVTVNGRVIIRKIIK
ncbi:MAG: hypothetical protein LBJ72_12380 [Dysgonamonadaceae bacterium]|jgi:hypothetical protein|nr:hypothetical protein [Dysgonamonadaceae bacterium]